MNTLNALLTRFSGYAFEVLANWPLCSLLLCSAAIGLLTTIAFRYTSNQRALKRIARAFAEEDGRFTGDMELDEDSRARIRQRVVGILLHSARMVGGVEAVQLLELASRDADPLVRTKAYGELRFVEGDAAVSVILAALQREDDSNNLRDLRRAAVALRTARRLDAPAVSTVLGRLRLLDLRGCHRLARELLQRSLCRYGTEARLEAMLRRLGRATPPLLKRVS